jgi:hypothetical protein
MARSFNYSCYELTQMSFSHWNAIPGKSKVAPSLGYRKSGGRYRWNNATFDHSAITDRRKNKLFGAYFPNTDSLASVVVTVTTVSLSLLLLPLLGKVHPCTGTEALYRPYGP